MNLRGRVDTFAQGGLDEGRVLPSVVAVEGAMWKRRSRVRGSTR